MVDGEGAVEDMDVNLSFFKDKRIFVTGHTGFKGMWLCKMLEMAGANVTGYALAAPTAEGKRALELSGVLDRMVSVHGDIRDYPSLQQAFSQCSPEIVIHLAAQPLVQEGYAHPVETYGTNVMGTVHILDCLRQHDTVRSFLNVTTDKVYANEERRSKAYIETDRLDGYDPYSNSKSCSELVTHSYEKSFLTASHVAVSTARAGNVIGGGDFAANRIIPDCIRAAYAGRPIAVRNPGSIRPYQHVLEPLYAYLLILQAQYADAHYSGYYNVGPDDEDCLTTGELAELFCQCWGGKLAWKNVSREEPHEASYLKLDCQKLKATFHWQPRWHVAKAIEKTVEWAKIYERNGNISACMEQQIQEFWNQ